MSENAVETEEVLMSLQTLARFMLVLTTILSGASPAIPAEGKKTLFVNLTSDDTQEPES